LKSGTGDLSAPQMTPKDEQTARIAEREKFVALLNANFELQQAQIGLLRSSGELETWLATTINALPSGPAKP
jgi:hypothetical protein